MNDTVLSLEAVEKRYGSTHALNGVSMSVSRGQFYGLAGVNGAGKSTLLKCMLDFCAVDAGKIHIFGAPHTDPRSRTQLTFLPERFTPPHYLTGGDFLRFMLKLQGRDASAADVPRVLEALDFDLEALARPVRTYSKGMTQKIGLAGCFLSQRSLYVLDEPMSGLDPKARAYLKKFLKELKEQGATLVFTSHSLADIDEVCDHMMVLHRGVPYYSGPPDALCQYYGQPSMEEAFLRCIEAPGYARQHKKTGTTDC